MNEEENARFSVELDELVVTPGMQAALDQINDADAAWEETCREAASAQLAVQEDDLEVADVVVVDELDAFELACRLDMNDDVVDLSPEMEAALDDIFREYQNLELPSVTIDEDSI